MKLNVTHQLLVYADDVNLVGEKSTEVANVANKEAGLEINKEKSEYM
jgi:hypothetical protein